MASGLGGLFRRLMGGDNGDSPGGDSGKAVEYKGCLIRPTPRREGSEWLTVGVISKETDGALQQQEFIRADRYSSREAAEDCAVRKGMQIIDEARGGLFGEG
jgi:hypothetical protein